MLKTRKVWQRQAMAVFFAFSLILSSLGSAFAASGQNKSGSDIAGHWAEPVLGEWLNKGLLSGFEDGSVKPNRNITRAEFAALVNKSQGFTEQAVIAFKDVKASDWFYGDVAKAKSVGYINGYSDQTFKPNQPISREEAAVILAKLLKLKDSESASKFADAVKSPAWSKGSIGAVIDAELMNGDKGKFRPADKLTRAEAVTILDRALKLAEKAKPAVTYDKAGSYGDKSISQTVYGSALISVPGVTLNNIVIEGDLVIGDGVGEGDVTLNKVTVKGKTTILGGGKNSIHVNDSVLLTVVVNKKDGSIRIVAEGSTSVQSITLQSGARLEESGLTGSGFGDLVLSSAIPSGAEVSLAGRFTTVDVIATSIKVNLTQGTIDELLVSQSASNTNINIGAGASVTSLILNAIANVAGQGSIGTATINASGSTIAQQPSRVVVGAGVTATVAGQPAVTGNAPVVSGGGNPSVSDAVYGFSGTIRDANDKPVVGATIQFRKGSGTTTGPIVVEVVTNDNGEYFTGPLSPGMYTGELTLPGFLTTYVIGEALTTGTKSGVDAKAVRIPASGEIRIVLMWGENPWDEDSHLLGPDGNGGYFHTWYGNSEYSVNRTVYADLDIDDTEKYGPETTTIRHRTPGSYQFYVHNFSGESSLRNSLAQVQVYVGDATTPAKTYTIPTGSGNEMFWNVFKMDIATDGSVQFEEVNQLTDVRPEYTGPISPLPAEADKFLDDIALNGWVSVNNAVYLPMYEPLSTAGVTYSLSNLTPLSAVSATYLSIDPTGKYLVLDRPYDGDEDLTYEATLTLTWEGFTLSKSIYITIPTFKHSYDNAINFAQEVLDNEWYEEGTEIALQDALDDALAAIEDLSSTEDELKQALQVLNDAIRVAVPL